MWKQDPIDARWIDFSEGEAYRRRRKNQMQGFSLPISTRPEIAFHRIRKKSAREIVSRAL